MTLYPFFLEGVAMDPDLNQPDGLHPNEQGVAVLVDRIAPVVAKLGREAVMSAGFAAAFAEGDRRPRAAMHRRARRHGGRDARHPLCQRTGRRRAAGAGAGARARNRHRELGRRGRARHLRAGATRSTTARPPSVLTAAVPEESFRIFAPTDDPALDLPRDHARWIEGVQPSLALVHADPRCPDLARAAIDTGAASGAFLVGGLVSHRCEAPLVAGAGLGGGGGSPG